ncbi:carbamoyltransferase HypF [Massilibacteroides sp.]|uniref:carbamoyltransferase HypF n=1 Tax=Massilibacteroides sp. TaxID=2034766 RepID=UPI002628CF8C|nr:carbamoyltransferase HypF [Massilibacteroides sp.]MDD4515485.1 carbamoyltransferase HypF [Massilibacteroides sp.]
MVVKILIQGLVQGVGFRPFVYLLAKAMGVKGEVSNCVNGVIIQAELTEQQLGLFIHRIKKECPPVATIHRIDIGEKADRSGCFTDFKIVKSQSGEARITQVAPDIAICEGCLQDRKTQLHRINYPFINCTHCGPRFSIVKNLPYDRDNTTVSVFEMCETCKEEYKNITDRRFHAQPVACNHCGPVYYAILNGEYSDNYEELLNKTVNLIHAGEVIAVKGVGGYHLVCDALNDKAVQKLRAIKYRDSKPFAVMFGDLAALEEYAYCHEKEEEVLTSYRRPIIMLKQRKTLSHGINPGMNTVGAILPYMAIHYDWFERVATPALVMTSGNLSECPIAITPEEAELQFGGKVALLLHHNRAIYNRVDDSIEQLIGLESCIIRRSRGYVPEPFFTDEDMEGILAFRAEKTNVFALGKDNICVLSQYIGDLKNWETFSFYKESMSRFQSLFRFKPKLLVCDMHPDYLSSQHAGTISRENEIPLVQVQHHHAHAAACMLEYNLNEKVIAIVWDGVGLGDDGNVWGGEFFLCDRKTYIRLSHFEYVPMPGGDMASKEPWRMAVSYYLYYGLTLPDSFVKRIGEEKIKQIRSVIDKNLNCPLTSSAGRLFDGLASLLGLCDVATHQAQAAVLLEQSASEEITEIYPVDCSSPICLREMFAHILTDMEKNASIHNIAAKIHNTFADLILRMAKKYCKETGVNKVILSGGCFQNKRLTELLLKLFSKEGISLYIPRRIPCNDGGIAAGQLTIAAAKIER